MSKTNETGQGKSRRRKTVETVAKLCVSLGALAFVFTKIDFTSTWEVMRGVSVGWLLVAVLVYILSQVISSERVRGMLGALPVAIDWRVNMRLYWLGMFYNFFLPGGVGGDGYKVYWINKRYAVRVKSVVMALLGDRVSGLVAICLYTVVYVSFHRALAERVGFDLHWLLLLLPVGVMLYRMFFWILQRSLLRASTVALLKSIVIQGMQMGSAAIILLALGVRENYADYLFLFLASSIASALPVTLGGIGAREMTFMLGSRYLAIDQHCAVSLSLLFYAVTLVSSLPGIVLAMHTEFIDGKSVPPLPSTPDLSDAIEEASDMEEGAQ